MKKIIKKISVNAFIDKNNWPCCAIDFNRSDGICQFYRVREFGTMELCRINDEFLLRRGEDELGTLIPTKTCPIWSENES